LKIGNKENLFLGGEKAQTGKINPLNICAEEGKRPGRDNSCFTLITGEAGK